VKRPRLSISKVMLVVATAAINLGVGRILYDFHPDLPVGMVLNAFALQAAAVILFYRRGKGRAFWAGFLACGLIAMMAFIWGMVFATNTGIAIDPATGSMMKVTIPGSVLWTFWSGYFEFIQTQVVEKLGYEFDPTGIMAALIWYLPQLFVAMIGGLLAGIIIRWRAKTSFRGPSPAVAA
jgi:hypothetical protein